MRRHLWKRMIAVGCATVILATSPSGTVLADEIQEKEITMDNDNETIVETDEGSLTESDPDDLSVITEDIQEYDETLSEDITADGIDLSVIEGLDSSTSDVEIATSLSEESLPDEEIVGATTRGRWTVGDNVIATIFTDGGKDTLYFTSNNGTLWEDWKSKIGYSFENINTIYLQGGSSGQIMHLPTDSSYLFKGLSNVENIIFDGIHTDNVTKMDNMFYNCCNLKVLDLHGFNTTQVIDMGGMFSGCEKLESLDISSFYTPNLEDMSSMFNECHNLAEVDLRGFNTSKVTSLSFLFNECFKLSRLDLSNFNTSRVKNMTYMFFDCDSLTQLDLGSFNTSNVTDMSYMFGSCNNLKSINVGSFNTAKANTMRYMFGGCQSLDSINLSNFRTSNVKDMALMFDWCSNLKELNVSTFDTSNVTDMEAMFSSCRSLESLNLGNIKTSNVTNMRSMFSNCESLTGLDLSMFDTSKVTNMTSMFHYCSELKRIDLSSFDMSMVTEINHPFDYTNLLYLRTPKQNSIKGIDLPFPLYDNDGKEYTELPTLSKSIILKIKTEISDCIISVSPSSYTYNGSTKKPTVTVKDGSDILVNNKNYKISYFNNVDAGTATVTIAGIGSYEGEISKNFTIGKASPTLDFASSSIQKKKGDAAFTNALTKVTDGTVAFTSSKTSVATINSTSGLVTIKGPGTTTVTATATAGKNYKAGSASYKLTVTDVKTDISSCTITLSTTSYTYNGSARKPTVTVKNGSITLTDGTDYTVTYKNNTNAGTATVNVEGIGKYSGTSTKNFTISKANPTLKFASASLTKIIVDAAFTNTLTKKTDGTVTFKSSRTAVAAVNSSSGLVTIQGTGTTTITANAAEGKNYKSGSASYTLTVTQNSSGFTWSKDNWSFTNSSIAGYFESGRYVDQMLPQYKSVLASKLTNTEYQYVFDQRSGWLYDRWAGSCYGMSSLAHLSKKNILPYADYQSGATCLHDLQYPRTNAKVSSLITYYQMIQIKSPIQYQYRTVPSKPNKENISRIISLLQSNDTVLIGFQKSGWGGHAILAYGYEYGSYTWNGVTYQGCIKICDPNASTAYNKNYNIYFNTTSYNWTIPGYSNMTSSKGAKFNYVGANVSEINNGGYLSGKSTNNMDDFVARIDAAAISDNRSITKVHNVNGNYIRQNNAADDIEEAESFILGSSNSTGTVGYNLYDADSAYKVTQDVAEELRLKIDYENMSLQAESAAGHYAIFDKRGYVEVSGESAQYLVGMTLNDNHPTKWFSVEAKGSGANKASMLKTDEGYLLNSDNLKNVEVNANNRDEWVTSTFSTDENQVLICESSDGKLDARIDADDNGSYETSLYDKKSLKNATIGGVSLSYGYTGKANTPTVTVKVDGKALAKGTDYTVKYENNVKPGTAKITVTGKGNYTGTKTKTFEIVDCVSSVVSGKTYLLIPKNNSKTAVCAYAGKMVNNTKIYITDRGNSESQKFKAVKNSDGTWKFINAKCELALAVQQNSSALGAGLVLYDQTTRPAQNWKLSKKSDNSFAIINSVTGYSIAMSDKSAVKGTTLSMAETASVGLQRFYIVETSAVSAPFDGTKSIRAAKDKNFAVNIASSSKEDGANVSLYTYTNSNAMKFKIIYSGGGYYRLVNVNSGLCLTIKDNSNADGANIIQSKWKGYSSQRWKITKNSDGTVTITNMLGTVLHLLGNRTVNNTNIHARKAASTTAQKWYLN